jgi:PAS domain S-box-containing protein
MTIDPQMLRSEQHVEIARLIDEGIDELVRRWQTRAVQEQPGAARAHEAELRDQLPTFLRSLASSLASCLAPETNGHWQLAAEHGEQRWEVGWSLSEVVRDYQILRLVLFGYLEEELRRPLLVREVQAVGLCLDEAIASSIAAYVRQRDEHERRLEQEKAERQRQLEEGRLRWQRVFENAGWGIALLAASGDVLQSVNPVFAHLHGYGPADLEGRPLGELVTEQARAELPGCLERADREGRCEYESVQRRQDGSTFPALVQLTSVADRDGRVLYRALNLRDVSEAKQTEQSLRDQARALAEADRRKNEFLAVLAHELRNPLAPIRNAVEVLRMVSPGEPAGLQARDIIERQSRQLARLVDDLLDVTRIAQGRLELRRSTFDVATAVAQAIQQTAPLYEAQRHRLDVHLPTEPLRLEADQARVVQVLVNLLNNAGKYTERGGQISLTAAREDSEVVFRVRDNGVGIEPEMLGRVFDLFTQIDRSLHRSQGGLGIGLTLVRQLVQMHGGSVEAHSEGPGKGSEFVVRLPASAQLGEQRPAPATASGPGLRHILIVEDNVDNRTTLAELLRLLGHRVEVAADGHEGVARALAGRPQVVLIDLGLPGLDGYEVGRQLRAELGEGVLLVALTGHATEEDRRRSAAAGFNAHLAKPVELRDLEVLLVGP